MKTLAAPGAELFSPGHASCPGCAVALAVRLVLKALGPPTVVVIPPSCIAVMAGPLPLSSIRVPVFQTAFETTAASAAGLARAFRARGEAVTVACLAGDGGTHDIGLQALSGAAERNEDFVYFCFDNEAYQNTGNQKSSATPWGARTTSTPRGKPTRKKDIVEIMAAHRIPYVATACPAYPEDLLAKIERARALRGTRFIHLLCPCVPGWGIADDSSLRVARLAVESRLFPLYEVEDGLRYTITHEPAGLPVRGYLAAQSRYRHLTEEAVRQIQAEVDQEWTRLAGRAQSHAPRRNFCHGSDPGCRADSL
ncbi:MAG: pyruvate synthase subunit beta [Candidatus Rokubacteria bacterium]|nr:pyruvate synthase subunit beta [Candidatus Rokubacteria bacterium]